MPAMKMRQSLDQLEQEFHRHTQLAARQRQALERRAAARSQQRWRARERRRSSLRFYLLTASLALTAVIVTVAMFATLYLLLA
jgi:type VI protein secretion system component VasF